MDLQCTRMSLYTQVAKGVDESTLQAEAVQSTEANLDDLMAQLKALGGEGSTQ